MSVYSAPHDAAIARLSASRARLTRLLLPAPPGDQAGASRRTGWAAPRRWRAIWRLWARHSLLAPVLSAVEQGLAGWWQRHPLRAAASMAVEVGGATLGPMIRRHPFIALGLGVAAGAGLAYAQPWRWRAVRVQTRRSLRQATGWAAVQLTQPAVQLLLAGLLLDQLKAATANAPAPVHSPAVADAAAAAGTS